MQSRVDRIGSGLVAWMKGAPRCCEPPIVVVPAEGAGTVAGGEGGCLIEKEQLGEPAGLEESRALPALEFEPTGDPTLPVVTTLDETVLVVEAPTVPVDEPAGRVGDQLPERGDTILPRHPRTVARVGWRYVVGAWMTNGLRTVRTSPRAVRSET